jgi:5'-nucleotidase
MLSQHMRRLLLAALLFGCAGSPPAPVSSAPVHLQLLAFNDFHGNLEPPSSTVRLADGTVPAGGASWLSAHVAHLRAQEPNTLVVAAGDLIGASPLASALERDEPSIAAMDGLGLDVSSVGNHEFDRGVDELRRLQKRARFTYLAANVVDAQTGQTVFPASLLKRVDGATVGLVGVVLKDTPQVVRPEAIAGLRFIDEAEAVNAAVPKLRAGGADVVVVLIHQGATPARGSPPNGCQDLAGPLTEIVSRFRDVDLVVSGHTHQAYLCPDLGGTLVTQAGAFGRFLTRILLTIEPTQHRVLEKVATQVPVTHDLPPDPTVARIVDQAVSDAAPLARRRVGRLGTTLSRNQSAGGDSPLGDVVADAQLAATRGSARATLALTNPGGLRTDLPAGDLSYGQAFAAQPFGNTLVTLTLSGAQLHSLLEQQWTGTSQTKILQPSANVGYAWSESAPKGTKLVPGSLKVDGRLLDPKAKVRVTVNSFLASGGDGFSVLAEGTERVGGPSDLDALVDYLKPTLDGPPLPAPAAGRIHKAP